MGGSNPPLRDQNSGANRGRKRRKIISGVRFFSFVFVGFALFLFFMLSLELYRCPLIFSCRADHVLDWQPRILLDIVEARSVNVKNTPPPLGGSMRVA